MIKNRLYKTDKILNLKALSAVFILTAGLALSVNGFCMNRGFGASLVISDFKEKNLRVKSLPERAVENEAERRAIANSNLFNALNSKDETGALKALEQGADANIEVCYRRLTNMSFGLLHMACMHGLEKVALELIERGADVNDIALFTGDQKSYFQEATPLHFACNRDLEKVALKLVEKGASLNARRFPSMSFIDRGGLLPGEDNLSSGNKTSKLIRFARNFYSEKTLMFKIDLINDYFESRFKKSENYLHGSGLTNNEKFCFMIKLVFWDLLTELGGERMINDEKLRNKIIEESFFAQIYADKRFDDIKQIVGFDQNNEIKDLCDFVEEYSKVHRPVLYKAMKRLKFLDKAKEHYSDSCVVYVEKEEDSQD